jgi:hypothetical protein
MRVMRLTAASGALLDAGALPLPPAALPESLRLRSSS